MRKDALLEASYYTVSTARAYVVHVGCWCAASLSRFSQASGFSRPSLPLLLSSGTFRWIVAFAAFNPTSSQEGRTSTRPSPAALLLARVRPPSFPRRRSKRRQQCHLLRRATRCHRNAPPASVFPCYHLHHHHCRRRKQREDGRSFARSSRGNVQRAVQLAVRARIFQKLRARRFGSSVAPGQAPRQARARDEERGCDWLAGGLTEVGWGSARLLRSAGLPHGEERGPSGGVFCSSTEMCFCVV